MIKGHCGPVRTVAFSPDGERLLTGSDDKTLKGWDVGSEKFLFTLSGHLNWVRSGEFNDDGRLIVSGSDDKTICLWDSERHYCIHQFTEIIGMVACTRFHPDGHCIGSCGSDQCIQIWDIRCKMLIQHYTVTEGWVHSLCFHPSGDFMISTCDDATLRVWDLREGRMLYMLRGHEGPTTCAEFSKTGEYFASGSSDEHVMIWQSNFSDSCCTHPGPLAMTLYTTHSDIKCSNVPSCQNETCEHDSQMEEDFQSDVPVNDNGIIRQPPKLSKIHKTSKGDKFMESSNNGITTKAQLYNTKQCEDMIEYSYGLDNELGTFETTLKVILLGNFEFMACM
ncbi:hypothetical protein O6H91_09G040300 [Diphasiastrum complanatum]|uniref:Uncharacterized protein n=1 Tax=Diphasiastrum complanatum TaxID=34168 RepID=A0ACC2CND8_DIPCM|nr:hypothetical protein O6H91_09G040300 [Diphasiastrum complanatum]